MVAGVVVAVVAGVVVAVVVGVVAGVVAAGDVLAVVTAPGSCD